MPFLSRDPGNTAIPSRRSFLRATAGTGVALGLGDLLSHRALGQNSNDRPAKSVILVWLWGGPSQLDTFDPKPDAPLEYRGPFDTIATRTPGLRVCELLPRLATISDKYAILRSLHHESNDHGIAGTIALTGNISGAVGLGGQANANAMRPSTGSIVSRLKPVRAGGLPPYVILGTQLHQGLKRVVGEGGGTLGATFDPFRLNYEPGVGLTVPDVELPENLTEDRLRSRWDLLRGSSNPIGSHATLTVDRHYDLAHTLITSKQSLAALDLESESDQVRERYGRFRFGQCCLTARRLVEAGLPFVQVNWSTHVEGPEDAGDGGWDMHDRYFAVMQDRHGWMFDQSLSALIEDLDMRGLLDSTLVVAVGEFGRTPKVNNKAGRDHWNPCYSALLAGGGVKGGRIVGSSDRRAEHPVDRPATPADLNATILSRLGIHSAELTSVGLTPLGQPISELF